ncbi:MAG: phosphopantetheine-binding protein [Pseudomonadota bacterium]
MRANEIRVVEIVSDLLGVRREDVSVDCSFADDLGADSLTMVTQGIDRHSCPIDCTK